MGFVLCWVELSPLTRCVMRGWRVCCIMQDVALALHVVTVEKYLIQLQAFHLIEDLDGSGYNKSILLFYEYFVFCFSRKFQVANVPEGQFLSISHSQDLLGSFVHSCPLFFIMSTSDVSLPCEHCSLLKVLRRRGEEEGGQTLTGFHLASSS